MYDYLKLTYRAKRTSQTYLLKHPSGTPLKININHDDRKLIMTRLTEYEYENALEKMAKSDGRLRDRIDYWVD